MTTAETESEEVEKECSATNPQTQRPGEYWIVGILVLIVGALFVEAAKLPGIFQGFTHDMGTLPQIMTSTVLLLILLLVIGMVKRGYRQGTLKESLAYIFSPEVVILLVAVGLYALLVEWLHFNITTLLFLWACMFAFDRKRPLHKLLVSAGTLVTLVVIFSTIFNVLLP
jgi:hypothetical protein